jgi:NADPH:quinone reductase-like Zn-dependent oxidoreductase
MMSQRMKAVRMHDYGGPEVLVYEEIPRPVPVGDEVLIAVEAAGVNPVDWKIREGYLRSTRMHTLPHTLGCDVAGTVAASGDQVRDFAVGQAVYAYTSLAREGTYADFVIAKQVEIAAKPAKLDFTEAAAIPVAGLTSWQALFDTAGLMPGQRVLIHAAAGGVGSIAVQLAKWKGAHVIATASAPNRDFVQSLGADEFIDYTVVRFDKVVQDVDVVFDTIGGETQERSFRVLKKGGFLVSIVNPPAADSLNAYEIRGAMTSVQPNGAQLTEIATLIDAGLIKTHVDTVLPLSEARKAQELSQTGRTRGKIVLSAAASKER